MSSEDRKDIMREFWVDRGNSIHHVPEENVYNHTTFRCGDAKHALEVRELWESGLVHGGTKMLDLGCGTGRLCQYFYEHVARVVGIDIGEGFIYRLNTWVKKNKVKNAEFITLDFWQPDFYKMFEELFSLVIIYGATIYVSEDDDYINILNNVRKVIEPGGNLIIKQTTSIEYDTVIVDSKIQEDENSKRYAATYHTPEKIIGFANKAGFRFLKSHLAYDKRVIGKDLYYEIEKWDNTRQMYYYFVRR